MRLIDLIDVVDDRFKAFLLKGWDAAALDRFLRNIRRIYTEPTAQGAIRQASTRSTCRPPASSPMCR
ncbi:MAG: hypothetical protein HC829_03045 [Bacteroidales bacterium]|nr:hypothetical protein [Bacteroidales bacterium]